jgi:hypothetical protein
VLVLSVDRTGVLNAFADGPGAGTWQEPVLLGGPSFPPGGRVALVQQGAGGCTALAIDRTGVLNAFGYAAASAPAWQGPVLIGGRTLVPGAPIAVFQPTPAVCTALTVDRDGFLNAASLDTVAGTWQGPDLIGLPVLVPGGPVSVAAQGAGVFLALAVGADGVLNTAVYDPGAGGPPTGPGAWRGPAGSGNATLSPGTPLVTWS